MASKLAKKIVKAILADLTDRKGLSDEWDQIDADIKREIKKTWVEIVDKVIEP